MNTPVNRSNGPPLLQNRDDGKLFEVKSKFQFLIREENVLVYKALDMIPQIQQDDDSIYSLNKHAYRGIDI